jgi:anaerobic magnesium-protoporphyrin IX monomethyl ester cyclase
MSPSDAGEEKHMSAQLYLVNPPPRKRRTNERAQSGGLGVSRKLKPFEKTYAEVLPHDFLYQAAVAEQEGHRVELIDLPLEQIYDNEKAVDFVRGVVRRGLSEDPSAALWLGVRISIPSLHSDLRMANMLKDAFPGARVYLFGNVLMTTYRHWIDEARVDYLFYGEPEAIIADALAAADPATVSGVIAVKTYVPQEKPGLFEMSSTALYRNWRQMRDISKLPRAAWHLLEMGRYAPNGKVNELAISVPASRGCFMPCTMCPYNLHEGRSMRFRTPEEVLDEIEFLYRTYGIRHIRFRDPNFSANKPHLRTIAQGMLDRHLSIEAAAELSLELLDRDLLELMHRAGIRTILTGVESDDPNCMSSIGQHVKINRILEGKLAICRELGIHVYTFFLIGSPEETWHSVRRTFTFAKRLGGESTMTIMTPFPGTPMYWRALRENLLVRGKEMTYEDWNSYTATMRTYKLSLRDVTLARTWARLETYIPYTWRQAKNGTLKARTWAVARLAPRVATLLPLRLYAWWKLRQEEREDPALRTQSTEPEAATSGETSLQLERYGAPDSAPVLITATVRRAERVPVPQASGTHSDAPTHS